MLEKDLNVLYRGRSSLREIPARQFSGEPRRRWFMSAHCDLIVWMRDGGEPQAFQFCYDKDDVEHALTWSPRDGFTHCIVDCGGSTSSLGGGTPFLIANGAPDAARILEIYRQESEAVPPPYSALVIARLNQLLEASAAEER
jgi:hypothetical protein